MMYRNFMAKTRRNLYIRWETLIYRRIDMHWTIDLYRIDVSSDEA